MKLLHLHPLDLHLLHLLGLLRRAHAALRRHLLLQLDVLPLQLHRLHLPCNE